MTRDLANSVATPRSLSRLRWRRIVAGAFLLEVILILVLVPPVQVFGLERVIPFMSPAVFICGFGVAYWILRKVPNRPVLHGLLIGIGETVIYLLLCLANPEGISSVITAYGPFTFVVGNGLRIVACVAGGWASSRRR